MATAKKTAKKAANKKHKPGWPKSYLNLFSKGLKNAEIATKTGKTPSTVSAKRSSLEKQGFFDAPTVKKSARKASKKGAAKKAARKAPSQEAELVIDHDEARPVHLPRKQNGQKKKGLATMTPQEARQKLEASMRAAREKYDRSIKVVDENGTYMVDTHSIKYFEIEGLTFRPHGVVLEGEE